MMLFSIRIPRPCASSGPDRLAPAGFGLVEVAISLGIVGFAILSLLGLMAAGLEAGKSSQEDTAVASIAKSVLSDVRTNDFSSLQTLKTNVYFRFDGAPCSGPDDGAYYAGTIESLPHAIDPGLNMPWMASNAVRLRMVFSWPCNAAKPNEQTFETLVANH